MAVIVFSFHLYLYMQSVVSLFLGQGEVYLIQPYIIVYQSLATGLRVLWFTPPIKLTTMHHMNIDQLSFLTTERLRFSQSFVLLAVSHVEYWICTKITNSDEVLQKNIPAKCISIDTFVAVGIMSFFPCSLDS